MLATVGLMLSIAALLIVVGLGQTQIVAAESKPTQLFQNLWFDAGLFVASVGALWGGAAIAAMGSQNRALREFPALEIEIIAGGLNPTTLDPGVTTTSQWLSELIGVRITNRELTRSVSLGVRLKCKLTPGFSDEPELRMPPKWQEKENTLGVGGMLPQLRPPIALEPQTTIEGFMMFDFVNVSPHLQDDRLLEFIDHNSGRSETMDIGLGRVHDFT